jgi:hypothetical protein
MNDEFRPEAYVSSKRAWTAPEVVEMNAALAEDTSGSGTDLNGRLS